MTYIIQRIRDRVRRAGVSWGDSMIPYSGINDANTKVLLHLNGDDLATTITDEYGHTFTAQSGAKLSTSIYKFGPTSLLLNGTSDYVSATDSADFAIGTGAFTIDVWVYPTSISGTYRSIMENRPADNNTGFALRLNNGKPALSISTDNVCVAPLALSLNTWYHIAAMGNGGANGARKLYLLVNGFIEATVMNDYNFTSQKMKIGTYWGAAGDWWAGNIDEVRFCKGIMRYTTPNYVVPTIAY
jgi:hypothetical protein